MVVLAGLPAVLVTAGSAPASALDNGLAQTPPMGFNDWNAFGCNTSEQLIEQTALAMHTDGMQAVGYNYVNIDDCWLEHQRDANGNLVPDPVKFPDGIKSVAGYVHSLGMKLGIYEDAGTATCAGYPGSLGHEQQDAATFASWGVDYLKYDNCNNAGSSTTQQYIQRYSAMRDALAATGRPIVYSLCEWGVNQPWTWAADVGNLWRTTGDISDSFGSMLSNFEQNVGLYPYAHSGAWNDPDMLEIGNGGMTMAEQRAEFSLWAEMSAPLIAGTDLRNASQDTLSVYENHAVVAVDQDPMGKQGEPVASSNGHWVMTKSLSNGDRAVVLFNSTSAPATITTTASQVGLGNAPAYALTDLWQNTTTETAGAIRASVPAHSVVMYRAHPTTDPDSLAPNTSLGVVASSQSLSPGQSTDVTETLYNNGRNPVSGVALQLGVPNGWTATATSPTAFGAVAPEKAVQATWHVTPPPPSRPIDTATLTGTARYTWGAGTPASVSGEGQVGVISPVQAPYKTYASTQATFGQVGDKLAIDSDGTDVWTGNDEYGAIYRQGAAGSSATATVTVDSQQPTSDWAKAGIVFRNDLTKAGSSPGYVMIAATPGNGIALQWDSDGNGYLDSNINTGGTTSYPVHLKLVRNGSAYTGYYSTDGSTWTQVGTATVPSAAATQDAGVFSTSHSYGSIGEADFSGFGLG